MTHTHFLSGVWFSRKIVMKQKKMLWCHVKDCENDILSRLWHTRAGTFNLVARPIRSVATRASSYFLRFSQPRSQCPWEQRASSSDPTIFPLEVARYSFRVYSSILALNCPESTKRKNTSCMIFTQFTHRKKQFLCYGKIIAFFLNFYWLVS